MAGSNTSERTKVMMKNFMADHKDGLTIGEIAEKYGLSTKTVYRRLGEIAEKEGLLRDDLLEVVHIRASDAVWKKRHEEAKANLADLKENIGKTLDYTSNLLDNLKIMLEDAEGENEI